MKVLWPPIQIATVWISKSYNRGRPRDRGTTGWPPPCSALGKSPAKARRPTTRRSMSTPSARPKALPGPRTGSCDHQRKRCFGRFVDSHLWLHVLRYAPVVVELMPWLPRCEPQLWWCLCRRPDHLYPRNQVRVLKILVHVVWQLVPFLLGTRHAHFESPDGGGKRLVSQV